MDFSLTEINNQIKELTDKRREIFDTALDGRTQRWLSEKTGINEARISACISGILVFSKEEIKLINTALGTNFKA